LDLEYVSETCVDFVAEVVSRVLADAAREPDGFAPFTAVLYMDGNQRRSRHDVGDDPEATLEQPVPTWAKRASRRTAWRWAPLRTGFGPSR
jgi:hypothetical protein